MAPPENTSGLPRLPGPRTAEENGLSRGAGVAQAVVQRIFQVCSRLDTRIRIAVEENLCWVVPFLQEPRMKFTSKSSVLGAVADENH
jgi:hypothetical protein